MDAITQVRVLVGKQFGISEADAITPANLSPEERTRLFDYSNAYIAGHPDQFTADQVKRAKALVAAWGTNTPLLDTSFDWGALASEMGDNALKLGESVASVGQGVMSTLNMMKWLLPLVVAAFIGIWLWGEKKKRKIFSK